MARLFFALWPPQAVRDELAGVAAAVVARSGGRAVPASKVHLTLAFLGDTPEDRIALAMDAADDVRGNAFDVCLDRLGSFPRAGVAWAGMSQPPAALLELAAGLSEPLRRRGFVLDERPFAAHVTLARRIERTVGPDPMRPVSWEARELALVESDRRTGEYGIRGVWELGAR